MTRRIVMLERKWFFNLQDGRESNEEFDTQKEIEAELKRRKKAGTATGICISSHERQITD